MSRARNVLLAVAVMLSFALILLLAVFAQQSSPTSEDPQDAASATSDPSIEPETTPTDDSPVSGDEGDYLREVRALDPAFDFGTDQSILSTAYDLCSDLQADIVTNTNLLTRTRRTLDAPVPLDWSLTGKFVVLTKKDYCAETVYRRDIQDVADQLQAVQVWHDSFPAMDVSQSAAFATEFRSISTQLSQLLDTQATNAGRSWCVAPPEEDHIDFVADYGVTQDEAMRLQQLSESTFCPTGRTP